MHESVVLKIAYWLLVLEALASWAFAVLMLGGSSELHHLNELLISEPSMDKWLGPLYLCSSILVFLNGFLVGWFAQGIRELRTKRTQWLLIHTLLISLGIALILLTSRGNNYDNVGRYVVSSGRTYTPQDILSGMLLIILYCSVFGETYRIIRSKTLK